MAGPTPLLKTGVAFLLCFLLPSGSSGDLKTAKVYFEERFDSEDWESRWVHSDCEGADGPTGRFEWSAGEWFADGQSQKGLRTSSDSSYHCISAKLPIGSAFSNRGRTLVVQFSVKHEKQEFTFCAGGYIKLLGSDVDQKRFGGSTAYKIMFGPDICGHDMSRIHLIFNRNGLNLARNQEIPLAYDDASDGFTHLYSLVLKPDNTYQVFLDLKEKSSGSLHEFWDFEKTTRDDPTDARPHDWVDEKRIVDPKSEKPSYWVDEQYIQDPKARKPEEWDDEEDGVFTAPKIDNPLYRGPWFPSKMDNPEYRGEWRPRQIGNAAYEEEVYSYSDIGAVGFELWTVNSGSVFDNILITDSWDHAKSEGVELRKLFSKEGEAKRRWSEGLPAADNASSGSNDSIPEKSQKTYELAQEMTPESFRVNSDL